MAEKVKLSDKIYTALFQIKHELELTEKEKITIDELVEEAVLEYFRINIVDLNKNEFYNDGDDNEKFYTNYYLYVYLNPLKIGEFNYSNYTFNCEPVYIGIGQSLRYKSHLINSHNQELKKFINYLKQENIEPSIQKVHEKLSKKEALILENNLIFHIGKKSQNKGPLLNITGGNHLITEEKTNIEANLSNLNLEMNNCMTILKTLNKYKNYKKSASELQISERTLYRKIKLFNIKRDRKTKSFFVDKSDQFNMTLD